MPPVVEIGLLAGDEVYFNGIDGRNGGQQWPIWADEVPDLSQQITGDLGADLRVHQAIERADPFFVNRSVPGLNRNDHDLRRRRGWRLFLFAAWAGNQ